jgi:DNA polymerase-1
MTVALLLVDGHALLHRAWFGFATRIFTRDASTDRTGVFGFAALLRKAQTQHARGFEIVVAFDAENGSRARAAQDGGYKAQRPALDPGLYDSLALIKDGLDHSAVRWIEQEGCEADDVIATLTIRARSVGLSVDVMSTDKDFIQLLADPGVRLLNTSLREDLRYTTGRHIQPRYGVLAEQWPDYRALTGDRADNIPGLRGVGAKTAARLLADGRRLENITADQLRPSWAGTWEQVLLWREMITLSTKTDLPDNLVTGAPTPPLPAAPALLQALSLW